jgi:hypothetical protein
MTLQQMLNAIPVLQDIVNLKLPAKQAYSLFKLGKEINNQREFFANEERKLVEKFKGSVNEEGQISFEDPADQQGFIKEYVELNNMDADISVSLPIKVDIDYLGGESLTANDIELLSGIVEFDEQ